MTWFSRTLTITNETHDPNFTGTGAGRGGVRRGLSWIFGGHNTGVIAEKMQVDEKLQLEREGSR